MKQRTQLFLAAFGIATVSLLLAASIVSLSYQRQLVDRVERDLLPLTVVDEQLAVIRQTTVIGILLALCGALVLAWVTSSAMSRRVTAIVAVARRYAEGDLSPPVRGYGNDEIGTVARAFDTSVHELGNRLSELSRHRVLFDTIVASMTEGVLVVDGVGRIQMASDALRDMLNVRDLSVGRSYLELVRHPQIARQIAGTLETGESTRLEVTLNSDPSTTLFVGTAPLTPAEDKLERPGVAVVLHDVTDYRRAEQSRRDFVANVSHELRTPLTAIRASVDALLEMEELEESHRFLNIIAKHSLRMDRLVSDLLRLARLDAGQETVDPVACSTGSLFAEVQVELAPLLEGKKLVVGTSINPSAATVVADHIKLHEVFKNLIENAAHYAPANSEIALGASADEKSIVLTVKDRGPGIPDADLVRVFERFYRVERSRVRDPGGTGLGLAIVKHLVGLHNGTVVANNRVDGGTVFSIRLPRIR